MSLPVETNPFKQEADDYLRKHHILELFEVTNWWATNQLNIRFTRTFARAFASNSQIISKSSLLSNLKLRNRKVLTSPSANNLIYARVVGNLTGIFGEEEIKNVFNLMDLQASGKISKEKCKEALVSLASSEYQTSKLDEQLKSVPAKVDYPQFKELWYEF